VATNAVRSHSSGDLALGLLVNPYVIAVSTAGAALAFALRGGISFAPLLVVAALLAGWSSAWSP
jgi:hypothetical protein